METETKKTNIAPPRMLGSIGSGFNIIANHIGMILYPVCLDIFLWFGVHIRFKTLLEPLVADFHQQLLKNTPSDMMEMVKNTFDLWQILLERFNLLIFLRSFPVGVPSLMASQAAIETPLGAPTFIEAASGLSILFWILIATLIGIALGTLFFSEMARITSLEPGPFSLPVLLNQFGQTLVLTFMLIAILFVLFIPVGFLSSLLSIFNMAIAQGALFLFSFVLIWLAIPLFFSPHGIFAKAFNAPRAVFASLRLSRVFLPNTSLFILAVLILSQGLDVVWQIAPPNSWMMLVGIFGHALINSALLAATFIYYRDAVRWYDARRESANVPTVPQDPPAAGG